MLPAVGGLLGYFYSEQQDPVYEAGATILVQYRGGGFAPGISDFARSEQLASTYRRLVTARPFLEQVKGTDVIASLGGRMGTVSASVDSNPPVLVVSSRDKDPIVAAVTAQTVAEEFIDYAIELRLTEIARLQSAAAAQGITNLDEIFAAQLATIDSLSLLESVGTPGSPVLPRTRQNIVLWTLLGLILAVGGALVLESLRDTVRSTDQLPRRFGVTALGTVFKWSPKEIGDGRLVLQDVPASSYAEAIRQVRANIQFASVNLPGEVLLVTSPGPGEGKSTILSNLAVALAQTGKRVAVVDGDLRRPSIHRLFGGIQKEPGLSDYLADPTSEPAKIVRRAAGEGIDVITSGTTPPNPAELMGSARMSRLLDHLKREYDTVLIDSPPLLLVADGALVATQVDGVVVVVDGFGTRSSSLQAALETLRHAQVTVLGVIINKLKRGRFGYGYAHPYYDYSGYRYYTEADDVPQNGTAGAYGRLAEMARRLWPGPRRR